MTTSNITLPEAGQRVGVVCGPGEFPQDNAGTVLCESTDKWTSCAVVLMDDGKVNTCHGLNTGPGIGWHAL